MSLSKIMSPDSPATLAARVANLEKRIASIERKLDMLATGDTMRVLADSAPYAWGNGQGEPYYKKAQYQGDDFAPWVSHSSRLVANLTSSSTVRRTFGETLLLTGSLTGLSGVLVWWLDLPWPVVPASALCSFALSASALVLSNRHELHKLVAQQDKRNRNQELRVEVNKLDGQGRSVGLDILYVAGIDRQQLVDLAPILLRSESLTVHRLGGRGCILSQGQAQRLCQELETMGYATEFKGGNVPRRLTAKGRALFRGLVDSAAA